MTKTDPGVRAALLALVEPESRGDPQTPLRWTTKSLRHLADELAEAGRQVSAPTVAGLLREESFYPKGIKITDREMADLETQDLTRHDFHGDCNYTASPAAQP